MNENADQLTRDALLQLGSMLDEVDIVERGVSFLDDAASLWRFSGSNVLALRQQAAERGARITMLASERQWRALGRIPMHTEEPYVILVPETAADYDFVPSARARMDEPAGFTVRAARVFDAGQTFGRALPIDPKLAIAPSDRAARLFTELEAVADDAGFRVIQYDDQLRLTHGHALHELGEIHVPAWQPDTERTAVLAHELTHALLHGEGDPLGSQYKSGEEYHGLAELEAESGSYIVLRAHGIDSTHRSATYLATWADRIRAAQPEMTLFGRSPPSRSDLMRAVLNRSTSAAQTILSSTSPILRGGTPPAHDRDLLRELARLRTISADQPAITPSAPSWRRSVGLD